MQRIIYLLRHAEAAPSRPGQTDAMRSLTPRGRRQAAELANLMAELPLDAVVCSPATRTRETLAPLIASRGRVTKVTYEPKLYHSCVEGLIEILLSGANDDSAVMMVGHNPTISELADALAGAANIPESFSPATLVTLTFEGPWLELAEGRALLSAWNVQAANLR